METGGGERGQRVEGAGEGSVQQASPGRLLRWRHLSKDRKGWQWEPRRGSLWGESTPSRGISMQRPWSVMPRGSRNSKEAGVMLWLAWSTKRTQVIKWGWTRSTPFGALWGQDVTLDEPEGRWMVWTEEEWSGGGIKSVIKQTDKPRVLLCCNHSAI